MADKKISTLYTDNPVTIDPGDLCYIVENTGTTPVSGASKAAQLMRDYYVITPTVSSNNLTLALKHFDGTNPSADRPLYFKIGDAVRAVTGTLSVTKNAGTNWCDSGGVNLATLAVDYFVYIGYNATDGVTLGFSRIPYATIYSDFNTTSTNDHYAAISTITNATSTDPYRVIGRFAAALSGTASFNWSVPTFTAQNLIQYPIWETRWLTWGPTQANGGLVGWSASPASSVYTYKFVNDFCYVVIRQGAAATSNSTSTTISAPITAKTVTNAVWSNNIRIRDNSTNATTPGLIQIASAGTSFACLKDYAASAWTNTNEKEIFSGEIFYQI